MSLRVLPLALLTLGACAGPQQLGLPPDGPTKAASEEPHFDCSFYWRQSDGHEHTQSEQVTLSSDTQRITLHGFEVALTADWTGKPQLQLDTSFGDSAVRSTHVFEGTPQDMFVGGHGFTGLQYLTDDDGAELQYFCGAGGVPGKADPGEVATAKVSCEASATTNEGTNLGPEAFTVEPGGDLEAAGLGPFNFAVHYPSSPYEGTAVFIDAGGAVDSEGMPTVHTLYQFGAMAPPANTMAGPSCTGTQSLEHSGHTLRYRCWTEG